MEKYCYNNILCGYFGDRDCRCRIVLNVDDEIDRKRFDLYMSKGYRRIGHLFYKNIEKNCLQCIPMRVKIEDFILKDSFKRILKKNEDVSYRIRHIAKGEFKRNSEEDKKIKELFINYLKIVHRKNNIEESINHLYSLYFGYSYTYEIVFYDKDNNIIGVSIVDEGHSSLSSVYFFYDYSYKSRSPGFYSMIKEIEIAKSMGKKYYYPGIYIKDHPKMNYKARLKPHELLINNEWIISK